MNGLGWLLLADLLGCFMLALIFTALTGPSQPQGRRAATGPSGTSRERRA